MTLELALSNALLIRALTLATRRSCSSFSRMSFKLSRISNIDLKTPCGARSSYSWSKSPFEMAVAILSSSLGSLPSCFITILSKKNIIAALITSAVINIIKICDTACSLADFN